MYFILVSDKNECETNNGRGPCEDVCVNEVGGFRCECKRPGYELDDDGLKCKGKNAIF